MEWTAKALLTAGAVWIAILTARRCGRAIGGAIAGLPVVTAPWLVCTAIHHGAPAAERAAVASIAACIVLAVFAAGYAHAAARAGCFGATIVALACALLVGPLAAAASGRLDAAVALAVFVCMLALAMCPRTAAGRADRRAGIEVPLAAASAGVIGASSGSAATLFGAFGAALLTALPVVGLTTVTMEHYRNGAAAASLCVRGYLAGLYGKIAFGFVFAMTVAQWGPAASIAAATLGGCMTTLIVLRRSGALHCAGQRGTACPTNPPGSAAPARV